MPDANRNRGHIPLKDYYSVADVSALLGIGENEVRRLAGRPDDPLPFRRLANRVRGMFIARLELVEWVQRNAVLAASDDSAPYSRRGADGRGSRDEGR